MPVRDVRELDRAALAMGRRLPTPDCNAGDVGSYAQRLLTVAAFGLADDGVEQAGLGREVSEVAGSVGIASRALVSSTTPAAGDDVPLDQESQILAAIGFCVDANFATADLVLRKLSPEWSESSSLSAVVGMCSPRSIAGLLTSARLSEAQRDLLVSFSAMLTGAQEGGKEQVLTRLQRCIEQTENPFAVTCLAYCRSVIEQAWKHAIVTNGLSGEQSALSRFFRARVSRGLPLLMPSQLQCLAADSPFWTSKNLIVCAPTSGGKTLLGLAALLAAADDAASIGVYLTPLVSLADQVAEILSAEQATARVVRGYGNHPIPDSLLSATRPSVIVATPERFDAWLRRSDVDPSRLRVIVLDEAHTLVSGARGLRVDGSITRLLLRGQATGTSPKIVLLSAVLDDAGPLVDWLGGPEQAATLQTVWRPTARRVALWRSDGLLMWFRPIVSVTADRAPAELMAQTEVLPIEQIRSLTYNYAQRVTQSRIQTKNTALLVDWALRSLGAPVLVVTATRAQTRALADAVASRLSEADILPPSVGDAIEFIAQRAPHLARLRAALVRGVAYHNASLPLELRRLIERATASLDLKCVVSTTTLAEGVDLPFRATVLAEWIFPNSKGPERPFSGALVKNIAGRAGRAGASLEGDTLIVDNPIGPVRLTDPNTRRRTIVELVSAPLRLQAGLADDATDSEIGELAGVYVSQTLAALKELTNIDERDEAFAQSLLFTSLPCAAGGKTALLREVRSQLQDGDEPLARAASPLRLTSLGEIVRVAPLSPAGCRAVLAWLRADTLELTDLAGVAESLLRMLDGIPDTARTRLGKVLAGRWQGFVVRSADMRILMQGWLAGRTATDALASLPAATNSSHTPSVADWLSGSTDEHWEDQLDKVAEFREDLFGNVLASALRTARLLQDQPGVREWRKNIPWEEFANSFEQSGAASSAAGS